MIFVFFDLFLDIINIRIIMGANCTNSKEAAMYLKDNEEVLTQAELRSMQEQLKQTFNRALSAAEQCAYVDRFQASQSFAAVATALLQCNEQLEKSSEAPRAIRKDGPR